MSYPRYTSPSSRFRGSNKDNVDWFCLFIYLWVLTFPLEDCSEFGNFVITLIYILKCTHLYCVHLGKLKTSVIYNQTSIIRVHIKSNFFFQLLLYIDPWWPRDFIQLGNITIMYRPFAHSRLHSKIMFLCRFIQVISQNGAGLTRAMERTTNLSIIFS